MQITQGDCLEVMKGMADGVIDLTVTSPPYDNLRDYKGYSFDFESIAKELYRITKDGGVVVWVVGDATINGSETGTSFKQALYFKEIGFNLHDTMIYSKGGQGATGSTLCYWQDFEYMFILSKGRPIAINLIKDRKNTLEGRARKERMGHRKTNGEKKGSRLIKREGYGRRLNIWLYRTGLGASTDYKKAFEHPAIFPEKLAIDHIRSWSNEGDLVYDPFMGSGTTAIAAIKENRRFIGSEISQEYCDIANQRIKQELSQTDMFRTVDYGYDSVFSAVAGKIINEGDNGK